MQCAGQPQLVPACTSGRIGYGHATGFCFARAASAALAELMQAFVLLLKTSWMVFPVHLNAPNTSNMKQLIECVPNFSEGNDLSVIKQITDCIEAVAGVRLLNVDPGKATNRTVVTFVGTPDAVVDAAFNCIQLAGGLIDMRRHKGEHPRMGATDVCPFVPVSGITMEETAAYARKLAERVGGELRIPVYLYEAAQPNKSRSNLSVIRAGEYEGFAKKILLPDWRPDFGPAEFDARRGATVIGAREFLVALNETRLFCLARRTADSQGVLLHERPCNKLFSRIIRRSSMSVASLWPRTTRASTCLLLPYAGAGLACDVVWVLRVIISAAA